MRRNRAGLGNHTNIWPGHCGCGCRARNLTLLLNGQWTSRILRQQALALLECRWRRRRSGFRDYWPINHRRRRTRRSIPGRCGVAEYAGRLGRDPRRPGGVLHRSDLRGRNLDRDLLHGPGAGQSALRDRDYSTPVGIIGRGDIPRADVVVIDICNVRVVDNSCIGCIDARDVGLASPVRRDVNITRAQREPPHVRSSAESE